MRIYEHLDLSVLVQYFKTLIYRIVTWLLQNYNAKSKGYHIIRLHQVLSS